MSFSRIAIKYLLQTATLKVCIHISQRLHLKSSFYVPTTYPLRINEYVVVDKLPEIISDRLIKKNRQEFLIS